MSSLKAKALERNTQLDAYAHSLGVIYPRGLQNEVFDIELAENECSDAANRIIGVLGKKH